MCLDSDDIDLFDLDNVNRVIDYKLDIFARKIHVMGSFFHFFYLLVLAFYISHVYVIGDSNVKSIYFYGDFILIGIAYPLLYELNQFYQSGIREYLSDPTNYIDMVGIYGSLGSAVAL